MKQLLKHMLALARTRRQWTLCCLWYEVPGNCADAHQSELRSFAEHIGADANCFVALTYQELFVRIETFVRAEHAKYLSYLRDRYFTVLDA